MAKEDEAWCKDCLKIPLEQIFRPTSRARARKFILPTKKDARLGHPVCPMCRFTRETRRLYDAAYLMSYGHRPEPSVSTGKTASFLFGGGKQPLWPTVMGAEAAPREQQTTTSHAWFKTDSASHPESSELAILITLEDSHGATAPLPRVRSKHELQKSTINTAMLTEWLHSTEQDVEDLPGRGLTPPLQPKAQSLRLIDVRKRLVVPATTNFRYLALSYVWGTELSQHDWLGSLSGTKSGRSRGTLRAHLPDTFEDALKLTQDLGESYLWIDLFCIKQDDPQHVQEQIEQMHHIYASAICTIIAYDTQDAFSGLAGVSRPLKLRAQATVHTPSGARLMATWLPSTKVRQGAAFAWNSRAWCFQEKFFSPRLLFLQEYEIMMITGHDVHHDVFQPTVSLCFSDWSYEASIVGLGDGQKFLRAYSDLLHDYTARFLTEPADAINAFSGVLSALKHETHQTFRYGIPLGDAHKGLLWSVADEHILTPRSGFPTWAWCGWLGRIRYRDYLLAEEHYQDPLQETEPPDSSNEIETHEDTPDRAYLIFPDSEPWRPLGHQDHVLRIRSRVISCTLRKLPHSREPSVLTYIDENVGMARKHELGYHWTLLGLHGEELPDPANNPCWPDIFEASPHWFRFSGAEEEILECVASTQDRSTRSATTRPKTLEVDVEMVLIQRWQTVRDGYGKVMRDAVGCLVVAPVVHGEDDTPEISSPGLRRRVAAILIEGRIFDAFDPVQMDLHLV